VFDINANSYHANGMISEIEALSLSYKEIEAGKMGTHSSTPLSTSKRNR
jgi:hypothetical protein